MKFKLSGNEIQLSVATTFSPLQKTFIMGAVFGMEYDTEGKVMQMGTLSNGEEPEGGIPGGGGAGAAEAGAMMIMRAGDDVNGRVTEFKTPVQIIVPQARSSANEIVTEVDSLVEPVFSTLKFKVGLTSTNSAEVGFSRKVIGGVE